MFVFRRGRRLDFDIDAEGRLTGRRLSDAQGGLLATVSYLWDAQGRLSATETPAGQARYRYDAQGRLAAVDDPASARTEFGYTALGQLLTLTQPGGGVTGIHYDAAGRTAGLTDARANTTELLKDDFGHLVLRRNPDTGTTRHTYDAAGNRIATIGPDGHTISRRFDAANHLIEETAPEGVTRFQYQRSRLTEIAGPGSRERFEYDTEGRLTAHTRYIDGHAFTTGYRYDAAGNLSEKHLPDGQILVYHYYTEGERKERLRAVTRKGLLGLTQTTLVGEIDQDALDGQTGHAYGNGIRLTRRHDPVGRITAIEHSRQLRLDYHYDTRGHINGIELNGTNQRYRYDALGRLTDADTSLGSYRYAYDTLGNRTQQQHTPPQGETATETYVYPAPGQGNRLLAVENGEPAHYAYNAAGSPIQVGTLHYEYNSARRPVRVERVHPDGSRTLVAEYAYNRFGERIKKVVYSQAGKPKVTYYLYDGHHLTAEADEAGNITAQYLYLDGRPVTKLEGRAIYALHTDHLGAPRAATDEDGKLAWAADYSPYGEARVTTQAIALNLRLPGQYEDHETGTYYNYLRDYQPRTGRYLTSDPIGLRGGVNTYAYAIANPVRWTDPTGLRVIMYERPIDVPLIGPLGGHTYLELRPENRDEVNEVLAYMLGYTPSAFLVDEAVIIGGYAEANPANPDDQVLVRDYRWYSAAVAPGSDWADTPANARWQMTLATPNYSALVTNGTGCLPFSDDSIFIANLFVAWMSYQNGSLPYHPFVTYDEGAPNGRLGWNSNSFVAGVLISAGFAGDDIPNPPYLQPGLSEWEAIPLDPAWRWWQGEDLPTLYDSSGSALN